MTLARSATITLLFGVLAMSSTAGDLPPGIPRIVDQSNNVLYIDGRFTTTAYQMQSLTMMISDANDVASKMQIGEALPIAQTNLVNQFTCEFGYAYKRHRIGTITTSNYWYAFSQDYKFSDMVAANYDSLCLSYKTNSLLPTKDINLKTARNVAAQWLAAARIDVAGLDRDCEVKIEINHYWNGVGPAAAFTNGFVVPIYDVWWIPRAPANDRARFSAFIEFYAPEHKFLQLSVKDPTYIGRSALLCTNFATLFPGNAKIVTNYSDRPTTLPRRNRND